MTETLILSGELSKRGSFVKGWRKRFFVLSRNTISYYKTRKEFVNKKKPRGSIQMIDMFSIKGNDEQPLNIVITTEKRNYFIQCPDIKSKQTWITELHRYKNYVAIADTSSSKVNHIGNSEHEDFSATDSNKIYVYGSGINIVNDEYLWIKNKNEAPAFANKNGVKISREVLGSRVGWIIGKDKTALYLCNDQGIFPPVTGWFIGSGSLPVPSFSFTRLSNSRVTSIMSNSQGSSRPSSIRSERSLNSLVDCKSQTPIRDVKGLLKSDTSPSIINGGTITTNGNKGNAFLRLPLNLNRNINITCGQDNKTTRSDSQRSTTEKGSRLSSYYGALTQTEMVICKELLNYSPKPSTGAPQRPTSSVKPGFRV